MKLDEGYRCMKLITLCWILVGDLKQRTTPHKDR